MNSDAKTFKLRVSKAFDSLSKTPTTSTLASPWSLSDDTVKSQKWNRKKQDEDGDDDDEKVPEPTFDGYKKKEDDKSSAGGGEEKEVEVEDMIGLDCTLDNEEEEDEFDKLAVGSENDSDRVYLNDVNDHGKFLNSRNVIPESFKDHVKDPRADHSTVKDRLIEDIEGPRMLTSSQPSEYIDSNPNPRSILKRKEDHNTKLHKRVRFDAHSIANNDGDIQDDDEEVPKIELPQNGPGVPDYIANPSRYTRYTFESDAEVDETANRRAHMDFIEMIKKSKGIVDSETDEMRDDLPKSVKFAPKKKPYSVLTVENNSDDKLYNPIDKQNNRKTAVKVAAVVAQENEDEVCAMDEDEPDMSEANKRGRPGRTYRSKINADDSSS